jgi:hypothetical protein
MGGGTRTLLLQTHVVPKIVSAFFLVNSSCLLAWQARNIIYFLLNSKRKGTEVDVAISPPYGLSLSSYL